MTYIKFIVPLLFILLLSILQPFHVQSQSLQGFNTEDLRTLRADDISDVQLRALVARAEQEGVPVDQALQLAVSRGLSSSVASQLRTRIQQLPSEPSSGMSIDTANESLSEDLLPEFLRPEREVTDVMKRTFGAEIFRQQQTEFAPSQNIPTPETYTLGPGDELSIYIWGDQTNTYRLPVTQEGTIMIENLGPVNVAGLSIRQANEVITDHLKPLYSGLNNDDGEQTTFARLSIDRLRTIQVSVVGEAVNPGDYAIPSFSTVYNALYRAGGPNENGSYRRVRVLRNNELIAELDLYNYLVEGVQEGNIQLRNGDVIQIPPYRHRVEVFGETKRSDLYFEVKEGESLSDLIRFAGFFTDRAYTRQLRIHRNTPTERRILTVNSENVDQFLIQSGDVLYVDEILERFENRVSITGAVWRSGEFELRENMMLSELLSEAEGVRPDAFLTRGLINRMQDDYSFEQISFNVGSLLENPEMNDIPLKREDHIIIRSIHEMEEQQFVEIGGAVQKTGEMYYRGSMTIEDLILKADGFLDSASEGRIEISRRIIGEATPQNRSNQLAEIFTFRVNRDLSMDERDLNFELQPFDRVFVHRRPNYREQQTVTIEGEVLYPGTYTIRDRNERISDVIKRAGGVTPEAYLAGGRLVRQISSIDRPEIVLDFLSTDEEINQESLGFGEFEDTQDSENEVENEQNEVDEELTLEQRRTEINRSDTLLASSEDLTDEEREANERRIGVDLETILSNPGSDDDLYVRQGDVIRIPEQLQTVAVSGAVMQPVEIRYHPGKNLKFYIDRAGGYAENARSRRGYVVYANGDVDRRKRYLFGLIKNNPTIEPGAQIIIPMKPEQEGMSTGEIISVSATVVSMTTTLLIAIDRLSR